MQVFRAAALTRILALIVAVGATAAVATAQGTTASIAGFVTDESKAALPGATVTVKAHGDRPEPEPGHRHRGALPRRRALAGQVRP